MGSVLNGNRFGFNFSLKSFPIHCFGISANGAGTKIAGFERNHG